MFFLPTGGASGRGWGVVLRRRDRRPRRELLPIESSSEYSSDDEAAYAQVDVGASPDHYAGNLLTLC